MHISVPLFIASNAYNYIPVSSLVASDIVKFLSVASTAENTAQIPNIPSPSSTLVIGGIDTVTSRQLINDPP